MATTKQESGLVKRVDASSLVSSRPDFLKKMDEEGPPVRRGQEDIGAADMIIPRVALCQDLTPNRKKQNENYIEGLEPGDFFNTLTLERYGPDLVFVPLLFHKSRIKFKPMAEGGGVECMNPTGKRCALNNGGPCLFSAWGATGEPPKCDELYNYPSLIMTTASGTPDFAIISFKRTGVGAAKDLNSKVRMRQADMFAGTYRLKSKLERSKAGLEYFEPVVENVGWVSPELYADAEKNYNSFREAILSGRAQMDVRDMEHEGTEGGDQF